MTNCRTFPNPIKSRITSWIDLHIAYCHPECNCSVHIYHHPCDEDAPELDFWPCEKNGPIHDMEALKEMALEHWSKINECAAGFVIEHEMHPDWDDEEETVN